MPKLCTNDKLLKSAHNNIFHIVCAGESICGELEVRSYTRCVFGENGFSDENRRTAK